ncbi:MAG: HesA/MoeB/ThiF family protein [Candidatus Aureabacteria bacterium]|nr:HesA/MoeB/ThiF family protein [Candidatus Auribacterota bacterium]
MPSFTDEQLERYKRNLLLKEIGPSGQRLIAKAKVLVIGCGGLGSPIALYLAASGIGTLGLADGDNVELSNLQRQIIHTTKDIGKNKARSATDKISSLNPFVKTIPYPEMITEKNASSIIKGYDFVLDATDNFASKFLINDACIKQLIPFSHAGISEYSGQTMTVLPQHSACYRCVFGEIPPPEPPAPAGPLGVVPGILGSVQAAECLKFILHINPLLTNTLLTFDIKTMNFRKIPLTRNPSCKTCKESNHAV